MERSIERVIRTLRDRNEIFFKRRAFRELLLDLVNLPDDSCSRFQKQHEWCVFGYGADAILQLRDELKMFWAGDDAYCETRRKYSRFERLHFWLDRAHKDGRPFWLIGTYADGSNSLTPNHHNLPLSIALAASDFSTKMGICGNPECPQKYFFKGRKTQCFCDRRACSAYGQRQHKLKWWNAHKSELRPGSESSKKASRKNRRKR